MTLTKNNARQIAVAFGVIAATAFSLSNAKADEWDKKTILTINEPIQVRETLLPPGQYVFKLMNSASDRHIVQIFNAANRTLSTPSWRSRTIVWSQPANRVSLSMKLRPDM